MSAIFWAFLPFISALCISTMLIDFMLHEYHFQKNGFKFWKSSVNVIISVVVLSLFSMFSIQSTIDSSYSLYISFSNDSFSSIWCLSYMNAMWTFVIGKIFLYQFWIIQLHQVFNNSSYQIPVFKLKIISIIVIIPLILTAVNDLIRSLSPMRDLTDQSIATPIIHDFAECKLLYYKYTTKTNSLLKYIGVCLYMFTELIYSIIILRLFLSRILLLSLSFEQMNGSRIEISKSSSSKSTTTIENNQDKRNNELFLNLAIKTTNLIIIAVFTNYIILIKQGMHLPVWILNIDVFCNSLSVYLSYSFSSKYYNILFKPCHKRCYSCCARLCYCCCLPKKLSDDIQLANTMKSQSQSEISNSTTNGSNHQIEP